MGAFILKVAAVPRIIDGQRIYPASYAYKPWGRSDMDDAIWARLKLAALEAKWAKKPQNERTDVLVSYHGEVYCLPCCYGTVSDMSVCARPMVGRIVKRRNRLHLDRVAVVSEVNEPTNGS